MTASSESELPGTPSTPAGALTSDVSLVAACETAAADSTISTAARARRRRACTMHQKTLPSLDAPTIVVAREMCTALGAAFLGVEVKLTRH
jgi:hypothetical protein